MKRLQSRTGSCAFKNPALPSTPVMPEAGPGASGEERGPAGAKRRQGKGIPPNLLSKLTGRNIPRIKLLSEFLHQIYSANKY